MSIDERYQYLRRMQKRYQQGDARRRAGLLNEVVAYTGLHRKSAIRRLSSSLEQQGRRRERNKRYGPEVDTAGDHLGDAGPYLRAAPAAELGKYGADAGAAS